MKDVWDAWTASWRRMEALALRRGWQVEALAIEAPATPDAIARLEARHGRPVPGQLRDALTVFSRRVRFGWRVPPLRRGQGQFANLGLGGLRDVVWDIEHIDDRAIQNFEGWRRRLADRSGAEAPNHPALWQDQFAFAELANGDMLTIDCRAADGPQPVRYFSHELEGLHGLAIAPDFTSFVTEYSALGCAGATQDDWFAFCPEGAEGQRYLSSRSPAGKGWLAWLAREPGARTADEPPAAVAVTTAADTALHEAARGNDLAGVIAALDRGAQPDCCLDGPWRDEFVTAMTQAVRHDNIAMMELLLARGATLDTQRLPLGEAAARSTPETVAWLIGRGARVNGWKGDRSWPLHRLINERRHNLKGDEGFDAVLEALLAAGADPDAPWDNWCTMLMRSDGNAANLLLAHGADPNRRDYEGRSALHFAGSPQRVQALVAHGAEINALSEPFSKGGGMIRTPLQSCLAADASAETIAKLLELGADPAIPDGFGRNALWSCFTAAHMRLLLAHGLDSAERSADGGTLIHHLCRYYSGLITRKETMVELIRFLCSAGVDINARDAAGETALHVVARLGGEADVDCLLALGADRAAKDAKGKRPFDVVPQAKAAVRARLK